jgi:hypothetical protein
MGPAAKLEDMTWAEKSRDVCKQLGLQPATPAPLDPEFEWAYVALCDREHELPMLS